MFPEYNLPKNIQKFVKIGAPKRTAHTVRIKPNAPRHKAEEQPSAPESAAVVDTAEREIPPFSELGLTEPIMRAVAELGFEIPTPIQARAIPALLAGKDMIGQAQTGTGKTAAFGLPILQLCNASINKPQALVLEPTRELAVQVAGGIHDLGKYTGLRCVPVYGGQPIDRQFRALSQGAHIVIGTPGRVLDHLRRGSLSLEDVKTVVLDEADEMLALGFLEDVESILSEVTGKHQIAFFSATMPPRVAALTKKFQHNPEHIAIDVKRRTVESTSQCYYEVAPGKKLEALARVLDMESPGPTMVFCRTRQDTNDVAEALRLRGYNADALNGEMNQSERDRVLRRFREGQSDLLVATDVAARGLDIDTVTHVVNFDIPWDVEQYIHRIGRTGRAGRTGDAITLVEGRERRQLKFIEQMIGAKIRPVRIPTASDIAARRRDQFLAALQETLVAGTSDAFVETVESLTEDYSASDIAAAALQMLWKSQDNGQFSVEEEIAAGEQPEVGMTRIFIGLGRQEGLRPGDLVGAITNEANISGKSIGAIDILDRTAFVEIPTPDVDRVLLALRRTKLRGRKVKIDIAAPIGFN
jgi:ATP-dependent RNA helicase DeaD